MTKCSGCGAVISSDKTLCERCFRIRHYNEYEVVAKTNTDFVPILENIAKTDDLVILVCDLFDVGDLRFFRKYIHNDILLVLTKRDLLPKDIYEDKLLNYDYHIDVIDKIIVSSNKNYQFDLLLAKIKKYQHSQKVYVIGYTNAGKSTLINKLIYNYSDNHCEITTSPLPSTTLNQIAIKLDEHLTLIDTPGLLETGSLITQVTAQELKKIIPNKTIKPRTYQVKDKEYFVIDDYAVIEVEHMNITFFISNSLLVKRYHKKVETNLVKKVISVDNEDIIIKGLGFIKTKQKGDITIYTKKDVAILKRPSLL